MSRVAALTLGVLLSSVAPHATGAVATLTWILPTQNEDGTTIPASGSGSLVETRIEYGTCTSGGGFANKTGQVVVPVPVTSVEINSFSAGQTVCFRAIAKNMAGQESAPSNVAMKTFAPSPPKPPSLSVIETVAYEVQFNKRGYRLAKAVGSVPLGTECGVLITSKRGKNYYEIGLDKVTLSQMPSSAIVVAACA